MCYVINYVEYRWSVFPHTCGVCFIETHRFSSQNQRQFFRRRFTSALRSIMIGLVLSAPTILIWNLDVHRNHNKRHTVYKMVTILIEWATLLNNVLFLCDEPVNNFRKSRCLKRMVRALLGQSVVPRNRYVKCLKVDADSGSTKILKQTKNV